MKDQPAFDPKGQTDLRQSEPLPLESVQPDARAWAELLSRAARDQSQVGLQQDGLVADKVLERFRRARRSSQDSIESHLVPPDSVLPDLPQFDLVGSASFNSMHVPVHPEVWNDLLSRNCQLRPEDFQSTIKVLETLRFERRQVRRTWVSVLDLRWLAGAGLVAVLVAGVLLRAPRPVMVDPSDAYQAYQEANQGW